MSQRSTDFHLRAPDSCRHPGKSGSAAQSCPIAGDLTAISVKGWNHSFGTIGSYLSEDDPLALGDCCAKKLLSTRKR